MTICFPISNLAQFNTKYHTKHSFLIKGVSSSYAPKDNTVLFMKRVTEQTIASLSSVQQSVMIVPEGQAEKLEFLQVNNLVVSSKNARLEYAKIVNFILAFQGEERRELRCFAAHIGENVQIGHNTYIGHNVVIGDDVTFGDDVTIMAGAIINDNVVIGNHTVIRENAVIGGYGFGFERDEDQTPIRLPHLGGVIIGNHVEIGAFATVAAGTIEPTVVGDYTKTDDHVLIAHNCEIGEKCLIIGGSTIGGSVKIGPRTWLGPNCAIINGIEIGADCLIGIGAVVKKSVPDNSTVSGNPAKSLEGIQKERDFFKEIKKVIKKYDKTDRKE